MGCFTKNRLGNLGNYNIEADESYYGEAGSMIMMIESFQNQRAMFEGVIAGDFEEAAILQEASVLNESVADTESKLAVLAEANIGGFIDKVKEAVKKIMAKLKGIISSFLTRLQSVIIRDNKELVNKYKSKVLGKDLSKMKYKWSKMVEAFTADEAASIIKAENKLKDIVMDCITSNDPKKDEEKLNDSDYADNLLSTVSGITTTFGDFRKDFYDKYVEEKEEEEGLDSSRITEIMGELLEGKKEIDSLNKEMKAVDKIFNNYLRDLDKFRTAVIKEMPKKAGEKDKTINGKVGDTNYEAKNSDDNLKSINNAWKSINVTQAICNKMLGMNLELKKLRIAQARRVFIQAAAFNPKSVKEDAMLLEVLGESAEYELLSLF